MTTTNILVIGATGNIGLPLVQNLTTVPKVKVIIGARNPQKEALVFPNQDNLEIRTFDFLDPQTFASCLQAVDKVFFIRPPQLANPKVDMFPFLEYLQAIAIKQVVFISLIGVEKNPVTPHHKIEKKILELDLPYTFIRQASLCKI